jgi:membrane-associated phospholipid phosphatase
MATRGASLEATSMHQALSSHPGDHRRLRRADAARIRTVRPAGRESFEPSGSTAVAAQSNARTRPAWIAVVQEVVIVGVAIFLYFFVRGLMHSKQDRAIAHAHDLVNFEQRMGFFWEPHFQEWALKWDLLGDAANWVYIWGHWPVIITTLVWLLAKHRDSYKLFRNAMLNSGGIGLIVFMLYPMAPPRFLPELGFVDTVTLKSHAYRVLQPPALVNQYAAMPSLHVGWDLLMGIAIATRASRRWVKAIGFMLPVLMFLAIILTANHYISDGIVGMALASFGLLVATVLHRRSTHPVLVERPAPKQLTPERPLAPSAVAAR